MSYLYGLELRASFAYPYLTEKEKEALRVE